MYHNYIIKFTHIREGITLRWILQGKLFKLTFIFYFYQQRGVSLKLERASQSPLKPRLKRFFIFFFRILYFLVEFNAQKTLSF